MDLRPSLTPRQPGHALQTASSQLLQTLSRQLHVLRVDLPSLLFYGSASQAVSTGPIEDVGPSGHPHEVWLFGQRRSHQRPAGGQGTS